ncbi:MAG: LamG domain-containing protein, partial [Phycisphaerae bacterium]
INLLAESPPAGGSPWTFAPNKPAATVHPITDGRAPDAVEVAGGGLVARDTTRFNYDAELTVACRLKPLEGDGFVIGKWYGGDSYLLGWNNGRVTFATSFGGNVGGPTASAPLPAGQWRHVAATFDGRTVRLYLDGRLAAQEPVPTAPGQPVPRLARSPLPLGIGNAHATFRLGLAEIRLYDVALKPEDVARLAD